MNFYDRIFETHELNRKIKKKKGTKRVGFGLCEVYSLKGGKKMERLNYEQFKVVLTTKLEELLLKSKKPYGYRKQVVHKINQDLDAISMIGENITMSPTLYFNNVYQYYTGSDILIEEIAQKMFETMLEGISQTKATENGLPDKDKFVKNIFFQVINTEKNKTLLLDHPHREYLDLSIIYRYAVNLSDNDIATAMINNSLMDEFKLTEEELYEAAYENTRRILKPKVTSPGFSGFYMITNDLNIFGANGILYKDIIAKEAKKLGTDIYLIPSSIHEILIQPVSDTLKPKDLKEIIKDANENIIEPEEYLSDSLYIYKLETDTVEVI